MAQKPPSKKEDQKIPFQFPNLQGNNFDQERDILNRKPDIHYEEPDVDLYEEEPDLASDISTIDDARQAVRDLIDSYKAVEKLADLAQQRVEQRVGDSYSVQLDPRVDALVVEAIKRAFPEAKDPTKITFEMFKQCTARVNPTALPGVTEQDLRDAQQNPSKVDFGGYGAPSGMNRPEISSPARIVDPIDLKSFQNSAVQHLFQLLQSFNIPYIEWRLKRHIMETKHDGN